MISPWRRRSMSGPKEGILASLLTKARPGFKVSCFALVALVTAPPVAAVRPVVALHPSLPPLQHLLLLPVPRHCIHRVGKLVDSNLTRVQQILQGSEEKKKFRLVVWFQIFSNCCVVLSFSFSLWYQVDQ